MKRMIQWISEWWYELIAGGGGIYLLVLSRRAYMAMRIGEKYAGGASLFFLIWSLLGCIALCRRVKWKSGSKKLMQTEVKRKEQRLEDLRSMVEDAKREGDWS
ncbi:hypothetical protein [Bacteroides acidifaciens]|uniref:hypothetical protein n=1 Tax=Bacteroides acidifaciens TaxID=85831 RepID=UPI00248B04CA|nr:hypothetical protein [Bacteroides acidifaciens]